MTRIAHTLWTCLRTTDFKTAAFSSSISSKSNAKTGQCVLSSRTKFIPDPLFTRHQVCQALVHVWPCRLVHCNQHCQTMFGLWVLELSSKVQSTNYTQSDTFTVHNTTASQGSFAQMTVDSTCSLGGRLDKPLSKEKGGKNGIYFFCG